MKRLLSAGVALGVVAGACSSSPHASAPPASTSTTTGGAPTASTSSLPAPSTTASAPPATVASTTTSVAVPAGPPACPTAALRGSLTGADGTAGSIYYQLELTNSGSSDCVVQGYPGVSFVSHGQQVGAAAARTTGAVQPVTLAAGATASATLQITVASNYCANASVATDGLLVYPPDQTASLVISHDDQACQDPHDVTLHVGPFHS